MMTSSIRVVAIAILIAPGTTLHAQEAEKPPVPSAYRENTEFLEQAYASRTTPEAESWKQRVQAKRPELIANLDWLLANNRGEDALRFVVPFAYFLSAGNQQTQAYEFLTRVLELPAAQVASTTRARALYEAGLLAFRQRDQARSRALNEEGLRIAREIGDEAAAATALIGLSRIALRAHDYKTVYALAQESADIRAKLGDQSGRISAMHMVAAAARMEGNDARAQQIYESTLKNYRAQGDKRRAAGEVCNLGYVYLHQNDVGKALEHFRDALQDYGALKDGAGISYCLTGFAAAAAVTKDPVRAAQLYGAAGAMLERLGITLDPDDQLDWDRYSEAARNQIENGRYEVEYAQGQTLTEDGAIKLAQRGE